MKRHLLIGGIVLALAVQMGVIGWIVQKNERLLCDGTECRFACEAYDPHDP